MIHSTLAIRTLLLAIGLCFMTHCSSSPQPPPQGVLEQPRVLSVDPIGWSSLHMIAYHYADTTLDSWGHFKTSPNGCHQDAVGALALPLWNDIAQLVNQAVSEPGLSNPENLNCFDRPADSTLFGSVEVETPMPSASPLPSASPSPSPSPQFQTILETHGSQICAHFKGSGLAEHLISKLDQLAAIAFKEDCERVPQ
jgi:hypothetical protein